MNWHGLRFDLAEDGPPRLLAIGGLAGAGRAALPVVEIEITGTGRSGTAGKRHVDGVASLLLCYTSHEVDNDRLVIRSQGGGLRVATWYEAYGAVVRCWTEVTAERDILVEHVSSFAFAGLSHHCETWTASNPWSGEFRWSGGTLQNHGLPDVGMTRYGQTGTKNRIALTSTGSWPSSEHLPMGWINGPHGTLAWQIEHNGPWHAELADRFGEIYLLLSGPSQREHNWSARLAPGESFTTVPAAFTLAGDYEMAIAALTGYRRALRQPHQDNTDLPIVFNDFMNCLMGDPTTERLLPLIAAASRAGAEYFCIDAGWYDDELAGPGAGGVPGWWDTVGHWEPSTERFPNGLAEVTDAIKAAGMIPGLWLEPEIIGVRAEVGLPDEAYLRRDGLRLTEWGRHQLDLSHPAAAGHLDAVVDRLVAEFGVGYFKFDYNIDIGPADRLLEHNRAYLAWAGRAMDRHRGLVIEACAAGGMRLDGATLRTFPVQSLTDQQDDLLLAAIAAAAPTAVPPEQGAVWAYPHGDPAMITFGLVNAMLGRIHLSGRLDLLDPARLALVAEAIAVYKGYRKDLAKGAPRWPLGLPRWDADQIALAIDCGEVAYLAVWRRHSPSDVIDVPWPAGYDLTPLLPGTAEVRWEADALRVTLREPCSAALLRLSKTVEGKPCREN
ncbi:glycoside hydrolase family 36 protein [Streptosporangium sp. 'caverna']|uniref:glycoside hydrolase family 36 protein n=1 Tax=Streptosporangium sp. 'caverna' TaxID=2202249 RepID=UPI000D7E137E|nr:glycoside hydrolase family 36 protein [Streptosporangium sp. 'caverna']AWS48601.1 alpha-galactosidase [Streptosporangium sp. 'caverna']